MYHWTERMEMASEITVHDDTTSDAAEMSDPVEPTPNVDASVLMDNTTLYYSAENN